MTPSEQIKHEIAEAQKHLRTAMKLTNSRDAKRLLFIAIQKAEAAKEAIEPIFEIGMTTED